jgi:uncharacterized Ntn-hydrolase superfamily protein
MTFSIVAVDRENMEVGFAIASCVWNAGQVCSAKCEVGAIASQAQGNLQFLPLYFKKLEDGKTLQEILRDFKSVDENIEKRQIGLVTFEGESLAFTGTNCTPWAGHKIGKDYACQGNILTGSEVIDCMAEAFEKTEGMLVERLFAALQAGDNAGGDRRGKVSARVLVEKKGMGVFSDTFLDLNVEAHEEPVREVGRILNIGKIVYKGWKLMSRANKANRDDKEAILMELDSLMEYKESSAFIDFYSFLGDEYLKLNQREKAIAAYRKVLSISPGMGELFKLQSDNNEMPADIVKELLSK